MKKIFLAVLAIVGVCNTTSAQYTPQKNDVAVEIGFTPFKSNGDVFKLNEEAQFKVRWMISNKDALRFKLGVGIDNNTNTKDYTEGDKVIVDPTAPSTYTYGTQETKNKKTAFSINIGYERHFNLSDRIDLYAGGEVGFTTVSRSATENNNYVTEGYDAEGTLISTATWSENKEYTSMDANRNNSINQFTVAALTGIDFYVYKGLYLGAELGIKLATGKSANKGYYTQSIAMTGYDYTAKTATSSVMNYSSETGLTTGTTTVGSTTTTVNRYGAKELYETSNTSLKFYVEPAIRLGLMF